MWFYRAMRKWPSSMVIGLWHTLVSYRCQGPISRFQLKSVREIGPRTIGQFSRARRPIKSHYCTIVFILLALISIHILPILQADLLSRNTSKVICAYILVFKCKIKILKIYQLTYILYHFKANYLYFEYSWIIKSKQTLIG